jgi:hypothetical protein
MLWIAGGVNVGQRIGTTDETRLRVTDIPRHVNDIHTCVLHLLGLGERAVPLVQLG